MWDVCREGGVGREVSGVPFVAFGVEPGWDVGLDSAACLTASFVENILVSRLVIEGFSADAVLRALLGAFGSGVLFPDPLRVSRVGDAVPFAGRDSGELMDDDDCDATGDGSGLSMRGASLGALTVAMSQIEIGVVVFRIGGLLVC